MKKALILLCLAVASQSFGTLFTYDSGFQNGGTITDGDVNGWTDTRNVVTEGYSIYDVKVTLNISGGYNGDLYAYLTHGTEMIVLLNRVGVGTQNGASVFGYGNSGFNVTLANGGANGDIHLYGGSSTPGGVYAPDGRTVSPLSSASSFDAAGTVNFSVFNGLNPNGNWTLFVSDVVGGGGTPSVVADWSLEVSAVPEPTNVALCIFGGIAAVFGICRTQPVRRLLRNAKRAC